MPARTSPLRVLRRRAARAVILLLVVGLVSAGGYAAEAVLHDRARPAPELSAADRLRAKAPRSAPKPRATPAPAGSRSAAEIRQSEPKPKPTPPASKTEPVLLPGPALLSPGDEGPEVRELQARLRQIYWFNTDVTGSYGEVTTEAVRGFQAKREVPVTGKVDQRTMDRLLAMTTEPTSAALENRIEHNQPGALDRRCRTGRVLCIDKTSQTLRWVVDGRVRTTVDVRFGAVATPTREGTFRVYVKSRDHVSSLYDSSMPFAMFFDGGQAVHYSSDFAATGYNGASHGCVNVRDYDAVAALFDQVALGDGVVVYRS